MDLVRLHALSLTEYAAVVYFDMDVVIVGDIMPMFRCAATGEFIMSEVRAGVRACVRAGGRAAVFASCLHSNRGVHVRMVLPVLCILDVNTVDRFLTHIHSGWGGHAH